MEGFNHEENSIDREKLLVEVGQLARNFVDLEDDSIISAAVESDEFRSALVEVSKVNPERLTQIKEKLDIFFKRRNEIALAEEELSKIPEQVMSEKFDFEASRQKLLEERSALKAGEEIASFFKHPVVSYFTNLLVAPDIRKKVSDTYNETVQEVKDRIIKNEETGLAKTAEVLLPIAKAMNEEKREEIKKEFFGAKGMREALMKGADSAIEKEIKINGEEEAREVFGDEMFSVENSEENEDNKTTFQELERTVEEESSRWLKEGIRVTFESDVMARGKIEDPHTTWEFKRMIAEAVKTDGLDLGKAKEIAESYIADIAMKLHFNHAQTVFAYKIIKMIREFDGNLSNS